jgi:hypothetical protein
MMRKILLIGIFIVLMGCSVNCESDFIEINCTTNSLFNNSCDEVYVQIFGEGCFCMPSTNFITEQVTMDKCS